MKQPRERFPRTIRTVEELPPSVAEVVRQRQIGGIRHMIMIPPGEYPIRRTFWRFELAYRWRKTPERTLIFAQDSLTVIEVPEGGSPVVTSIPLAALVEVHLFLVLLYSWIEFAWEEAGQIKRLRAEYNSVGERQIWRGLTHIRQTFLPVPAAASDSQASSNPAGFPFKFRAYVYDSLLDDEPLLASVYVPAIRTGTSPWSPYLSPNRAVAVTDRALIVIEDRRNRYRFGDPSESDYTVSRHFYPLNALRAARVEPGAESSEAGTNALRLDFGRGSARHEVVLPLTAANAQELDVVLRERVLGQPASV